jgi:hypothetical protein
MATDQMSAAAFQAMISTKKRGAKFGNEWVTIDGFKFQSKKEGEYYGKLKLRKRAGDIKDFKRQVSFSLVVNGVLICKYRADFVIYHNDDRREVIDVKSDPTEAVYSFTLIKKLMFALHKIKITIAK